MPLPWKKTKVTRISRIVADLQSPKRGGSLVVETGFPTSLIDLFVKNRDRLRKPSMKKKKNKKKTNQNDTNQHENDNDDLLTSDSITTISHSGHDDWSIRAEPVCEEVENSAPSESVEEEEEETKVESETHEDQNRVVVFLAVLKIFAVVVLALSTKKLAVGITLSAFVLLLLECVGKRLIFRFLQLFRFRIEEGEFVQKNKSRSSIEETEVVEANNSNNEEVFRGPDLELLSRDKKWGFLDKKEAIEDHKAEVLVLEKSKSYSKTAKIRAKIIKNIVPKKLRSSKKDKKLKSSQDADNKVGRFEEKEEDQGSAEEEEEEEQKEELFVKVDDGNEVLVASDAQEEEGRGEETKRNWVCPTLFMIVLVGLFGGRILALLLAIAWCFVLKLVGRQRRSSFVISS